MRDIPDATLAERAYQVILDQILRGSLPMGSALSRRKIAEQLGMSFVPVSEALQRLEIEGLVESRPRAGTRVRVPDAKEVRECFELREALECQSARLCAERASFTERLELKRAAENVDTLFDRTSNAQVDRDYVFALQKYHVDLHMKVAEGAHSKALRAAIEKSHVLVFNWVYDTASGRRVLPHNFHQDLINVIAGQDSQRAEEAMRWHVRYGLKEVQQVVAPLCGGSWRIR